MANFVEFDYRDNKYGGKRTHCWNVDNIINIIPPHGECGFTVNFIGSSKNLYFKTQEEAQALYDLLRGKKVCEGTDSSPNNISICNQCQELIKNVSYCVNCWSKRYSPLEEEVKVTAKEFYKSATYKDENGVCVDITNEMNLRDKLDRIKCSVEYATSCTEILSLQIVGGDKVSVGNTISSIYEFLHRIKAILDEGEHNDQDQH